MTLAILHFVFFWNDFLGPLIYLQSTENKTMSLGLIGFKGQYEQDWNFMMAAALTMDARGLVVGVPLGLGLAVLAGQVFGLFFVLPPPLLAVPAVSLLALGLLVVGASALALGAALVAVDRRAVPTVLREP